MIKKEPQKLKRTSRTKVTKVSNGINLTLLKVRKRRATLALEMAKAKEEKAKKDYIKEEVESVRVSYAVVGDRFADRVIESMARVLGGVYRELAETKVSLSEFAPSLPNRKRYLTKILSLLILISTTLGLTGAGSAPVVGYTFGLFSDTEESRDNIFVAGKVDFWLGSTGFHSSTTAISLLPNETILKRIKIDEKDSNPFKYSASTTIKGDEDFCNVLNVEAKLNNVLVYDGPLVEMLTDATTTLRRWDLRISMGDSNYQNGVCHFDIDYLGSQTRHGYDLGEAFHDIETIENWVSSWGFRINKVYYDVAPDRGLEGDNEWVEIYNQTDTPLDINGWEICDNTSCDTLSALEPIPAMGYGIITASSTTASTTLPAFWYLPDDIVEIKVPDSKIGNGLGNSNDMLILKRPDGVIIDQMNWGNNPDIGWTNYNDYVWTPGSVDVLEGNALLRDPSGYDTNQPSDFVEITPPSIDLIYPDEDGSYTWYWTYDYTIEWTAINNNGDDNDLGINLFYIKDINHNDEIDEGDTMVTIVENTPNDGEYEWTVPSGFLGYIWLYLVGTGPENPMWNSSTISGDIYDPMPIFVGQDGADIGSLDFEAPVITIQGNNPAYLEQGASYADLGVIVTDNVNNNLGYSVDGDVDTGTLGEYVLTYRATDQAGNTTTVERLVVVYDPALGIPEVEEEEATILSEESDEETATSTFEIIDDESEENSTENTGAGSGSGGGISGEASEGGATSTPEIIEEELVEEMEDESASTTPVVLIEEDTATSTPLELTDSQEENSTSTPEIILEDEEEGNATTTLETLIDENATTTPLELTDSEENSTSNEAGSSTTTPNLIIEEAATTEEDQTEVEEESEDSNSEEGSEASDVVEESAVIEDPVLIEEETLEG